MAITPYQLCAKYPNGTHGTFYCTDSDDLQDCMWIVWTGGGQITWIGERFNLGCTPQGHIMYEYREIKEAYR
jgi:hypothetical protein